ncbi:hypothetical protein KAR91_85460 [Candidatus Pacearchaeota archaeon]|nr:hypothetical protein [Candidatus Pacearchaeota archaeon]
MPPRKYLTIQEFAKKCGVSISAVHAAKKKSLKKATRRRNGKYSINPEHPAAVEYYNQKIHEYDTGTKKNPVNCDNETKHVRYPDQEVKPVENPASKSDEIISSGKKISDYVARVETEKKLLENVTLKEIVMYHKTIKGYGAHVKVLKDIADFHNKDLLARQRRGELIERKGLGSTLIGLVDQAFNRLVGEMPVSVVPELIALAQTNSDTVQGDIVKLIQNHISQTLKDAKNQIKNKLEKVKSEV